MIGRIALDMQKDGYHQRRLKTAVQLAKAHDAQIVGIHTARMAQRYVFEDVALSDKVKEVLRGAVDEEREEMRSVFLETIAQAGVIGHWRYATGPAEEALAMQARFADLLVISQTEHRDNTGAVIASRGETVIMNTGRPVLMVPYAGDNLPFLGKRVLVCWDYGRRAARAFADAAPVLERASELVVLTVDPDKGLLAQNGIEPGDLAAYCKAHKYPEITEVTKRSAENDIGNTILNTAADYSCDLIVMGAYSRNRIREWAFGGTSKTLLQTMTVPILFSH